jgi:chromosome segregation ATPase
MNPNLRFEVALPWPDGPGRINVVPAAHYDALAQQLAAAETRATVNARDCNEAERQLENWKRKACEAAERETELAQQLAASQARVSELEGDGSWGDMALTVKLTEAQATITRLEAMATERAKEIAEARHLLRRCGQAIRDEGYQELECEIVMFINGVNKASPGDAYLSRHEEKAND